VSVVWLDAVQPVDVTGEVGSVTVHDTDTSDVYHPLLPSVPDTVGVMTGGVASRLIVTDPLALPPADVAEQVNVMAWVSVVTVVAEHPVVLVTVDSGR